MVYRYCSKGVTDVDFGVAQQLELGRARHGFLNSDPISPLEVMEFRVSLPSPHWQPWISYLYDRQGHPKYLNWTLEFLFQNKGRVKLWVKKKKKKKRRRTDKR